MKHILVDVLVICLLFNNAKDSCSFILTDHRIEFTLHTYWASWNEARYICEAENGSLVEDASPERKNMLMYYIENDMGPPRNFWIGLHYVSKVIGGASEWVWPSCIRHNLTQYSNWDYLEPQRSCVYYNVYGAEWATDFCDEELSFVCEKMIDSPCTFTQTSGFPSFSIAYTTQIKPVADVGECLSQCLSEMFNNTNCWAANLMSGQCLLYYTDDPFLFKISLGTSADQIPFYTKNCYTASKDISDNTPHDPNINSQPDQHCDKFENRNPQDEDDGSNVLTVASTTSTAAPATTTAVPTTSTAAAPTTSTAAAPTTSTAAVPTTSTAAAPTTSTAAVPTTSTAAVPTTSTAAAPTTSTAAVPTTSTAAAPTTSTAAAPTTSTAAVPTTSTAAVPTTSTAAVPTTSTAAAPTTSSAAVPTTSSATPLSSTPAPTTSSSYVIITLSTSATTSTATTSPASSTAPPPLYGTTTTNSPITSSSPSSTSLSALSSSSPISTTPATSINPTLSTTSGSSSSSSAFVSTSTSTVTVTVSSTTPIVSSTVSSATTSNVTANSTCLCMCACDVVQDTSNLTVVEKVEQIVAKLRVDKKKLSSTTRKKTCAEDERTSAKSVGYVAVVFITAELSTVFIPDLVQMGRFIYLKIMK